MVLLNSPKGQYQLLKDAKLLFDSTGLALVGKENEFMQKLDLTIEYTTALKCQKCVLYIIYFYNLKFCSSISHPSLLTSAWVVPVLSALILPTGGQNVAYCLSVEQ